MCLAIRARYNVIDVSPLGTLGDALGSLSRHADALDRYEQALAVARRIGDRSLEAIAFSNIGVEHTEQGRYEEPLCERGCSCHPSGKAAPSVKLA